MTLTCYYCGDDTVDECGTFVEDASGEVRHIGPCCQSLASKISPTGNPSDTTFKYASA